jgi:ethanolamine ammonia-lyase large subunit
MKRTLKELLAKATPLRSGDVLAGVAAATEEERVRAQMALAEVPLTRFLEEFVIPYEDDEVTRLIVDSHDSEAFAPVRSFSVGELRDWLLTGEADGAALSRLAPGLTPEMVAAVCKLMRLQDLVLVASKCRVVTRFRNTIGLPGTFSVRLQPNHPTDDLKGIAASTLDGLCYGCGDAVIGINPATDNLDNICRISDMLDGLISRYAIPTQSCVLAHVTTTMEAIKRGAPVDLCFQSIAGTQAANASFGVSLSLLQEALGRLGRLGAAPRATTSCISRPARAAPFRLGPTTEWTSRPLRPGPTPWPENSSRCWSTRWLDSLARNIC